MSSRYKIHTYNNNYCLNDAVDQCDLSTNSKEYISAINDKINYNSQSYLPKDRLCDILLKSKAYKSKQLLKYLQDSSTSKEKLEIVSLDKKDNQLINFVDYKQNVIQFNNKQIQYFVYNEQFYFKAKEIADILEYVDTKTAIIDHVDETDKFNKEYFTLGFKGGETPPFQIIENQKLTKYLEKQHPQTIFINESGLYTLIISSKKEEAKVFKKWVTSDVLPSIRKNGSYVSKKLLEYNKDELKNYYNKDCVYILHIKDNIYKYGKSSKIQERLYKHSLNLEYTNIEKIYVLNNINEINALEDDIKDLTKINKIKIYYNNGIEYFECNLELTIDKVIEKIDHLYKKIKNKTNNTDILLEKILLKLDNIDNRLKILENQSNNTGICIDCQKETSKFAIRCGVCENNNKLKEAMENGTKPTYPQLKEDLIELRYMSHVAKKYNVTPRTISRWIRNYEKYNQLTKPIENEKKEKSNVKKKCIDCDKMVYKKCTRCNECNNKHKIKINAIETNRPTLLQLKTDFEELRSMVKVGIKYGVSDNAIRKWIKNYQKTI